MQKKLTILWSFAVFALMFALSPNTASAKCVGGINTKNGKTCGGGTNTTAEYSVIISKAVSGQSGEPWVTESAKSIGLQYPLLDVGKLTDLSFFEDHFNEL